MKAILVIDEMPKSCCDCQFYCSDYIGGRDYCSLDEHKEIVYHNRPNWCPLRPAPQKNKYDAEKYATVDYENDVTLGHYLNKGWNACLDTITGETEC